VTIALAIAAMACSGQPPTSGAGADASPSDANADQSAAGALDSGQPRPADAGLDGAADDGSMRSVEGDGHPVDSEEPGDAGGPDAAKSCQDDADCEASAVHDPAHCAVGRCIAGSCVAVKAPPDTPCDDGKACTSADICTGDGLCVGTLDCPITPPAESQCVQITCSAAGACQVVNKAGPCDDGSACTTDDKCAFKTCNGTQIDVAKTCDDGNTCTSDACDPAMGCSNVVASGAACSSGNACITNATCQPNATCTGAPLVCPPGPNACSVASCDPAVGCIQLPAPAGTPCTDGSVCTTGDACTGLLATCAGVQVVCDDGNPCTADSCQPAVGCVHSLWAAICEADNDLCTGPDFCVGAGCVAGKKINCKDGNVCTTDDCLPAKGCQHLPNSEVCSDGTACTSGDGCADGKCVGGAKVNCDDAKPCTKDVCDQVQGCLHTPIVCNDGNPCTKPTGPCQPAVGCAYTFVDGGACDDGDKCTVKTICSKGDCVGVPVDCNDSNICTSDSCNKWKGCVNIQDACDDGNDCTAAICDKDKGCKFMPLNGFQPCDDGDVCTKAGVCKMDVCVATPKICNDGVECTNDVCQPGVGCSHPPVADGTPCAAAQGQCLAGKCV